jgi:hypothetical protein
MTTAVPCVPLQIGQVVCRRTEALDTTIVGVVGGLVFLSDPALLIVRWLLGPSTFGPEDALVEVFRLRP